MAIIHFSRKDLPADITEAPCLASVEYLEFYHDSTKAVFAQELSKHNIQIKHFFLIGENLRTRSKPEKH